MYAIRSILVAVSLPLLSLAACGADDDGNSGNGGGGISPEKFAALAEAGCARAQASGCGDATSCTEDLIEDHAVTSLFGCAEAHAAYTECLGMHDWKCEPVGSGGITGVSIEKPEACKELEQALSQCEPTCGYSKFGNSQCSMHCSSNDTEVEVSCPSGPDSCTCTKGPKAGTAVPIEECDRLQLATVLQESCS